jgi:hypothetical protein
MEHLPDFRRLIRTVTLRLGALQNQSELGRDTQLPQPTVHRYLNLLETSYQLVRLPAYTANRTTRVMKTPKLYWSDTGLALFLSGERELRGAHLENLVLEDLVAWRETRLPRPELFYWRTAGGREVDFVIESDGGVVLPVEVKATARPSTKDVQGLKGFLEAHGARAPGGVLLHTGSETFWIARDVIAAPWWTVVM